MNKDFRTISRNNRLGKEKADHVHYKMYKAHKFWLISGMFLLTFAGLTISAQADSTPTDGSATGDQPNALQYTSGDSMKSNVNTVKADSAQPAATNDVANNVDAQNSISNDAPSQAHEQATAQTTAKTSTPVANTDVSSAPITVQSNENSETSQTVQSAQADAASATTPTPTPAPQSTNGTMKTMGEEDTVFTVTNPGSATDPVGTQVQYLEGTLSVTTTFTGMPKPPDYTEPGPVKVTRTVSVAGDGSLTYSDWAVAGTVSEGPNSVLLDPDVAAIVSGYANANTTNFFPYTSDMFNKAIAGQTPSAAGYTFTLPRQVAYSQNIFVVGYPGPGSDTDPVGTQIGYLQGTITVNTKYVGGMPANAEETKTYHLQRAALTDNDVTKLEGYSKWTLEDRQPFDIPELTADSVAIPGYDVQLSGDTAEYTPTMFASAVLGLTPDAAGYTKTLNRTVVYTQKTYTTTTPGDPTKGDPELTQAKYLEATVTVNTTGKGHDLAAGVPATETYNVTRTATVDGNGKVDYSAWTYVKDGKTEAFDIPAWTESQIAVPGYTATLGTDPDDEDYSSADLTADAKAATPTDTGYTKTLSRTVNYSSNTVTTTDPIGGTTTTTIDTNHNITTIDKVWGDGDKTHVELDHTTNVITVTETPNGESPKAPITLTQGETGKTGKTTATNNLPTGGVTLTHDTEGVDTEGNPTTGTVGENVNNGGTRTYTKTSVPGAVSVNQSDYYDNTTKGGNNNPGGNNHPTGNNPGSTTNPGGTVNTGGNTTGTSTGGLTSINQPAEGGKTTTQQNTTNAGTNVTSGSVTAGQAGTHTVSTSINGVAGNGKNSTKQQLPQTSEDNNEASAFGAMLLGLSSLLGLFGLGKRRKHDDK